MGNRAPTYSQPENIQAMKDDYREKLDIQPKNTQIEARTQLDSNLLLITTLHQEHLQHLRRVFPSNIAESPYTILHLTKERDIARNIAVRHFLDTVFSDRLLRTTMQSIDQIMTGLPGDVQDRMGGAKEPV